MLELPSKFYFKVPEWSKYVFKAEINPNKLDDEGNICYRVTWTDNEGEFKINDSYSVVRGHQYVMEGSWEIVPDTDTQVDMFEPELSELGALL